MVERARWLLLTREGRRVLVWIYVLAAATSVVAYAIVRGPGYALGQVAVFTIAALWMRFWLRRANRA